MANPGLAADPHGERHAPAGPPVSESETLDEDRPALLLSGRAGPVARGDHSGRWPVWVVDHDTAAGRRRDHHGHGRARGYGYRVLVPMLGGRACPVRVHRLPRVNDVQRPDDEITRPRRYQARDRLLAAGKHQRATGGAEQPGGVQTAGGWHCGRSGRAGRAAHRAARKDGAGQRGQGERKKKWLTAHMAYSAGHPCRDQCRKEGCPGGRCQESLKPIA